MLPLEKHRQKLSSSLQRAAQMEQLHWARKSSVFLFLCMQDATKPSVTSPLLQFSIAYPTKRRSQRNSQSPSFHSRATLVVHSPPRFLNRRIFLAARNKPVRKILPFTRSDIKQNSSHPLSLQAPTSSDSRLRPSKSRDRAPGAGGEISWEST